MVASYNEVEVHRERVFVYQFFCGVLYSERFFFFFIVCQSLVQVMKACVFAGVWAVYLLRVACFSSEGARVPATFTHAHIYYGMHMRRRIDMLQGSVCIHRWWKSRAEESDYGVNTTMSNEHRSLPSER
jgi:hypothetical protein